VKRNNGAILSHVQYFSGTSGKLGTQEYGVHKPLSFCAKGIHFIYLLCKHLEEGNGGSEVTQNLSVQKGNVSSNTFTLKTNTMKCCVNTNAAHSVPQPTWS
jgi:hypothetical protein